MQRLNECGASAALEILLVEDNPVDVVLFKHILRKGSVVYSLTVSHDGVDAAERLKDPGNGQRYRPDVIFLDLNLPGKSGMEVLAEIKADPALAFIPIAVLTGSEDPGDHSTCCSLGVNAYWNKAAGSEDFLALAAEIRRFLVDAPGSKHPQSERQFSVVSAA